MQSLQRPERLPGKNRRRLAGNVQPMALGRTNENTEIESEGDTWKAMLVERRQVVSSLAPSWPREPPGATGILGEGRVVCRLARCARQENDNTLLGAGTGGSARPESRRLGTRFYHQ